MAKIGILGLRPRQIADLAGRKFNGHQVSCYDEKAYKSERVQAFCRDKDKVLILRENVPKEALEGVPATKRHVMTGSISTVMNFINSMPKPEAAAEPAQPEAKTVQKTSHAKKETAVVKSQQRMVETSKTPVQPVTTEEAIAGLELCGNMARTMSSSNMLAGLKKPAEEVEPKLLASEVPDGRSSQYHLPKHDIMINYPNSGGVMDYKILLATIPGDVIRFARPEGLALTKWRNRVNATRYHYWRKHGLYIEAHFYNEYVDFQIMKQDEPVAQNTLAVTTTPYDPQFKHESRPMGTTELVQHDTDGVPAPRMVPDGKGGWLTEEEFATREAAEPGSPEFQFDEQAETPAETAPESPAIEPPQKLFSHVPPEFSSQYFWNETAGAVIEADDNGIYQSRKFPATVKPGDVLRFIRPAGLAMEIWRQGMSFVRLQLNSIYHLPMEEHLFEEYADILFLDPALANKPAPAPAAEPTEERGQNLMFFQTASEETFWQQVYVAATATGNTAFEATDKADKAIRNLRKRQQA